MGTSTSEDNLRSQGVVPKLSSYQIQPVKVDESKRIWSRAPPLPPFCKGCPPLVIGGSAFGKGISSKDEVLQSDEPYRIVKAAFDYGICAIDTSPYYHPSEISIGRILESLSSEYPRESYYIQTKVGRYGGDRKDFDYSPQRIKESVQNSLERLKTTYFDSVVLHDVEFVCNAVGPSQDAGFAARDALSNSAAAEECGLAQSDAARIHGSGDEQILTAIATLFSLKDKGIIRNVGIGGYPLPTLLRLSRLIATKSPFRPIDVIVNYCHHTLQSDLLNTYAEEFAKEPNVRKEIPNCPPWQAPVIINASPFSMGLLTDQGPPDWHPASDQLKQATKDASRQLSNGLSATAAHFGLHNCSAKAIVVGMNSVEQVHQNVSTFLQPTNTALQASQAKAIGIFEQTNVHNWSWASPS